LREKLEEKDLPEGTAAMTSFQEKGRGYANNSWRVKKVRIV